MRNYLTCQQWELQGANAPSLLRLQEVDECGRAYRREVIAMSCKEWRISSTNRLDPCEVAMFAVYRDTEHLQFGYRQ